MDIGTNKINLKLGDLEVKLALTMKGGMFLAKKYGSIIKAFKEFEKLGKGGFELNVEQIDIISDMLYSMSMKSFQSPEDAQESIDFSNVKVILMALTQALMENLPKEDEGTGSTPPKP